MLFCNFPVIIENVEESNSKVETNVIAKLGFI
jgi:hypothetical protein